MAEQKADAPVAVTEPQFVLDLGQGLQLWKVPISVLREQDTNARAMPPEMFNRLAFLAQDSANQCPGPVPFLHVVQGRGAEGPSCAGQCNDKDSRWP
jgi:hypothetical protein